MTVITSVAAVGLLAIGASLAAAVFWLYDRAPSVAREQVKTHHLTAERLRAYREIMDLVVSVNRHGVELSERHFEDQMERLAMGNESDFEEPYEELTATYQSYYYVIEPGVREAVSDYLDYLKTYHDGGAEVGKLLSKSGGIVAAMRAELELESIFPTGRSDSSE
jgi:hypothetical protein